MKKKDPNFVAKLEKAIADKYGNETIQNPKLNWDEEKEQKYVGNRSRTVCIAHSRAKNGQNDH